MTPDNIIHGHETLTKKAEDLQRKLAKIRGAEHLEQPLGNLGEAAEEIARRIEGRVQRVLAKVMSGQVWMGDFNEEYRRLGEGELTIFIGGAGAGKTFIDHLFEAWVPKRAGIETTEITWERHGIGAGRASQDPERQIPTAPGDMLDDDGLFVAGDFLEEALWSEVVQKRSPSIAMELASSSLTVHSDVNKKAVMSFGKERGLMTVYNLLHRKGRFADLPKDLKIWVNLVGLVGGFLPRNVMTYLRDDINKIDPESPTALAEAALVTAAYGKLPPKCLDELLALQHDGATYDQVQKIELENNRVVTQIRGMPNFNWPKGMISKRKAEKEILFHELMTDENVRIPLRASHLDAMFTSLGKPSEGITLSTFVGVNNPRLDEVNLDLEAIGAMGDDERRRVLKKASTL